ncbi:hypothetical protein [Aeromonas sp. R6-2]|uniref:hypothetical protein n=1 Tax=unclassified Aeromonas TaxID=257493 RepID=UPI0034A54198
MASNFKDKLNRKSWEKYCYDMLVRHFGVYNITRVPDSDNGDHGIEFFTTCGKIFQCYFPDQCTMEEYKKRVKKKITDDIGKLKAYEADIVEMLGDIKINRWILLTPEDRSKDIIKHCNKKKKELLSSPPSFIDCSSFAVQILTDEAYPSEAIFARQYIEDKVDLDVDTPSEHDLNVWKDVNSTFNDNIERKTKVITKGKNERLRESMILFYVQVNDLLDAYRYQFPNIHAHLSGLANSNLDVLRNDSLFESIPPEEIMRSLREKNRTAFGKMNISEKNCELLSIGCIAQWIAECKMEFIL